MRRLPPVLLLLALIQVPVLAQGTPPPLSFLGFEAGARLERVDQRLRALGSRGLRCDRARADRRVQECRAMLLDSAAARPLTLWLSAVDSGVGILTVSAGVTGVELDRWKGALERQFGVVDAKVQGGQWMLQWVRRGTMLRLTWKIEQGVRVASVSLVDGRVLDAWGRTRAGTQPAAGASAAVSP